MNKKISNPDRVLVVTIIMILLFGTVMVYSASSIWASYKFDDPFYFAKRQVLFAGVGVIAMFFIAKVPYYQWLRYRAWIFLGCLLLLVAVLIPGIGMVRGGARSWIGVSAFSIQPAEFMKLGMIIFLSGYLVNHQEKITSFKKGFLPPLSLIVTMFLLIMLQPDLGTGMVFLLTCFLLLFVAGAKIAHFLFLAGIGVIGFLFLIISAPYRINRITAFLDPWEDPLGNGFQIIQSLYAIGPGGLFGVGFGNSLQKYFYLPEPHNDFIFAIIAEELGFIGGLAVISLFVTFIWRGVLTAIYAPDLYARLLAIGIVGMIATQVIINISVVIGLIPVTGITLPFLSYGGSSLTLTLCSVGILINISQYRKF
ncbi:stage V sporulation protein E [Gracilibacillus halophilus YIM-C55.5]|uniref:Stage V sporulation protein E n=1 Tax=Gracilibacillus halophilus YIM-C55.5 TaxID=1308866 RepID=N4WGD9_9BACI|nr:stage V sporulation protein E [Gracilibacillus halophilus]ENH98329.1 stage V sporulation protein E [Gracilibacillus halophilus YIM-C55.5]